MTSRERRTMPSVGAVPPALRTAGVAGACVLIVVAAVYLLVMLLVRVAPLTLAVFAALLLTALVSPVTERLRQIRVPGSLAALAGLLSLLLTVGVTLAVIGNQAVEQFPDLQARFEEGLITIRDLLLNGPLPINEKQLDAAIEGVAEGARNAAPDPVRSAETATTAVAAMLLALVLVFFFLKDGALMWRWALRLMPPRSQERIDVAARAGWQATVSYVRGTVLVASIDAIGIGIALVIIGVPLALPLALLTFLAAFVPLIGATVAGAVAVLIALVSNGVGDALLVLAAVIGVQQAEGNLLQPLIMSRALQLHPVVVLVSVTAGTLLGGVAGAVVAVPLIAVCYRVWSSLHETRPGTEELLLADAAGRTEKSLLVSMPSGDAGGGGKRLIDPTASVGPEPSGPTADRPPAVPTDDDGALPESDRTKPAGSGERPSQGRDDSA